MKTKLGIAILTLTAALAQAQTNNLTTLLQQGLFEEQANRNLDAAIADYQSLAARFDQDRQLAATAVFRLGECYRMQGKTNEAAVEYQRILHDFSDQQVLATLSRQDLAGMGAPAVTSSPTDDQDAKLWSKLEHMDKAQVQEILPTLVPDSVLDALLKQRNEAQAKLAQLQVDYAPTNVAVVRQVALLNEVGRQLDEKVNGILQGLKMRAGLSQNAAPVSLASDDDDQEIQRIQLMIQNSPDLINAPGNGSLFPPLIQAAMSDHLRVARYLLDHQANVDIKDKQGETPLTTAAFAGHRAMVELLLSHGADVNARGAAGETALGQAARHGFQAVVEVLLANHADVNAANDGGATSLCLAASSGHLKIVQMLLAACAGVNIKDYQGRTPLNYAIGGSVELFQALLKAGTDPNTVDSNGRTPLSYATEKDGAQVVGLLLAAKADPNAGKLDAPLLCAIYKRDTNSTAQLLEAGADPDADGAVDGAISSWANNHTPVTPLYLAVALDQRDVVQRLLKYRANPNDLQTDGRSLLFSALSDTNILEMLLDAGAQVDARDSTIKVGDGRILNWTPLIFAVEKPCSAAVVEILLKHGADPNARDDAFNQTPLQWIEGWGRERLPDRRVLELLLDDKADPNVQNDSGRTPLDDIKQWMANDSLSAEKKALAGQLADLLRQHGALDNLPNWNRIAVSRRPDNFLETIFQKSTNNWNHFTLLELICEKYPDGGGPGETLPFPDLKHIVISRPYTNGTTARRVEVNLLNATNGVDCSRDVPLEFGDTVEIPEREHTLAEPVVWLTREQYQAIMDYFKGRAGMVKLIVDGGQITDVPLAGFEPIGQQINNVLQGREAQSVLTSDSDLSRVKVSRLDPNTGKKREWILNCPIQVNMPNNFQAYGANSFAARLARLTGANKPQLSTDLWLRNGDVIEVPAKP